MAGATEYARMAGVADQIRMAGATRYAAWCGPAGTTRQYASNSHYEPTICGGINTGFDMASITNGAHKVARQIEQDSSISEVMYPTYPGQYQLSRQATGLPPLDSIMGSDSTDGNGCGTAA